MDSANDIRVQIFESLHGGRFTAGIFTDMDGIISGSDMALEKATELGVQIDFCAKEGDVVTSGDLVMQFRGDALQLAMAEDSLIGCFSRTSGIATAANRFVNAAGPGVRIVCGSYKKLPEGFRIQARKAALTGGARCRISDEPMVYLDKNYVEMFGGIQPALWAVERIRGRKKAVQIRGRSENGDIVREAMTAVHAGADIVYVDTGNISDVEAVASALKPMIASWQTEFGYRKVEIAYGGGVTLEQIPRLRESGTDIIGVGRAIIDAPLLDMRMEIIERCDLEHAAHKYDLLDKSELMINGIALSGTNLNEVAAAVADVLGLDPRDVLVIDVRDKSVALDILQKQLDAERFVGQEATLLARLSKLPGVKLDVDAHVSSRGMLGWIAADEDMAEQMREDLKRSENTFDSIREKISKRAIVFPTGSEVENGEIEDTNTPLLISKLCEKGYTAEVGEVLKDDLDLFTGKLRNAIDKGFGVVITTGGVGAENKDYSVEAILRLDPAAAAPYIAKFNIGDGRHRKPGIRVAVGQVGMTMFVALPGPNDEVSLCADTLIQGLEQGWTKELLAHKLAQLLRGRLSEKMKHVHHSH